MDFSEDTPAGNFVLNAYTADSITINNRNYDRTVFVSPGKLIEDIPLQRCDQLSIPSLQFIIDLKPELFLLGTGQQLNFPAASIIATLAQNNIGFEAMDHSAACRTFSVLAADRRDVGALFLFDR